MTGKSDATESPHAFARLTSILTRAAQVDSFDCA
jgi:hypothetical protein